MRLARIVFSGTTIENTSVTIAETMARQGQEMTSDSLYLYGVPCSRRCLRSLLQLLCMVSQRAEPLVEMLFGGPSIPPYV